MRLFEQKSKRRCALELHMPKFLPYFIAITLLSVGYRVVEKIEEKKNAHATNTQTVEATSEIQLTENAARNLDLMISTVLRESNPTSFALPQNKDAVINTVRKYTEATACDVEIGDVYLVEQDVEMGSETYIVRWSGDMDCAGGSGTFMNMISEVSRQTASRPFIVTKEDLLEGTDINLRFIEEFKPMNNGKFLILSRDYANDDANCCPSKLLQYTTQYEFNRLKVINKKRIKQDKSN